MKKQITAIIDASTLIIFAKLNELESLPDIYGPIGIPPAVYEVVVEGTKRGFDDALVVEAAIGRGFLARVTLSPKERELAEQLRASSPAYGLGECEAIACAETRDVLLLIEERKAKTLARVRGVRYSIAQVVPFEGYVAGKIAYERCLRMMERIAVLMNTDIAVLNALRAAVETMEREREEGRNGG